jgi:hypothetical protein
MERRRILTLVKDTTDLAAGATLGPCGVLRDMEEQVRRLSATVDALVRRAE